MRSSSRLLRVSSRAFAVTALLVIIVIESSSRVAADDPDARDVIGKTTSQIIRLRKFEAQSYNLTVAPGVNLELVRIKNPKLRNGFNKNKRPVLFIHGIIASSNYFIVNSIDARPKDWSDLDVGSISHEKLNQLLAKDPSANSLPFLLSNIGVDVWLVNRRSTHAAQIASTISFVENSASLGVVQAIFNSAYNLLPSLPTWRLRRLHHVNNNDDESSPLPTNNMIDDIVRIMGASFKNAIPIMPDLTAWNNNPTTKGLFNNYWNFSLDEQAVVDLPKIIDFILTQNPHSKQVSTVSHSTGGAIMLMNLAEKPEYRDKIGKVALWAPAMDLGNSKEMNFLINVGTRFEPLLRNFDGPIEPAILAGVTELGMLGFCQMGQLEGDSCNSVTDAFDGIGSDQLNEAIGFSLANADASGSHELAQLLQSVIKGKMHYYDYGSELRNNQVYGKSPVEVYNLKKIKNFSRLSIWQGNTDALVTTNGTQQLIASLDIPVDYHLIDGGGIKFDHSAFMLHKNVSTRVNIPTMKFLELD